MNCHSMLCYDLNTMHCINCFLKLIDGCQKTKVVTKFFKDNHIKVLVWPGNSPDLNPRETVGYHQGLLTSEGLYH